MSEINVVEGNLLAGDAKFAIVHGRFNHFIVDRLVEGAIDAILRHGGSKANISIFRAPGSFELPMVAKRAAESGEFDAVIVVGALIRGATPHFDYIAAECTKGIAQVALSTGVPTTYGVITTNTIEQAIERAGTKVGNKGFDAAVAAIEMVSLYAMMDAE